MASDRSFELVASDLDGTLLRTDDSLSPRTRAAVHGAIATGAIFVYATGRPPRWTDPVVEALDHYGFAVASNGAYVVDLSVADHDLRVVKRHEISVDAAWAAVELLRTVLPDVAFACDGLGGFAHEPGYVSNFRYPASLVGAVEELLDRPYAKLLFRHPDMTPEVFAALGDAIGDVATLTFGATPAHGPANLLPNAGTLVEVQAFGVSKAAALGWVCERVGLDQSEARTVAFGDMPNDLEMLRWADHGVAMGNAHDDVKSAADEITASNDDDGVAIVLEREFAGL